jgi:hypothetical protein
MRKKNNLFLIFFVVAFFDEKHLFLFACTLPTQSIGASVSIDPSLPSPVVGAAPTLATPTAAAALPPVTLPVTSQQPPPAPYDFFNIFFIFILLDLICVPSLLNK